MDFKIINPSESPEWPDFVDSMPRGTFFHSAAWCKVLQRSYGFSPCYFSLWKNGCLTAAIPMMEVKSILTGRRGVSLPFTDYCDPLVLHEEVAKVLFDAIKPEGKRRGWKCIELRGGAEYLGDGTASTFFYRHTLELTAGADRLFKNLRDSTRRNIRKAEKEGVEVRFDNTLEALRDFYRINCLTRREHSLPPQPWKFFENVHREIISKGTGFVALACHEGNTVAANVYLHHGSEAIYKYGASDRTRQHLRANNLLMWEAIKWFACNGYRKLCFGRTERENEGLRQFKTGWGAEETVINYYRYDIAGEAFIPGTVPVFAASNRIFSQLPLSVSRAIGTMLYRHVG